LRFLFVTLLAINSTVAAPAGAGDKPAAATKILDLFQRLQAAQQKHGQGAEKVSFQLTEQEINEYMVYSLHAVPRPGLDSVTVKFFDKNYVTTFTMIDFDAVERWKPGTIPTLLKPVLNGRKSVWVDVRFQADAGKTTFSIEKAYFNNIRLPAFVVEKVIGVVAARQPEHYDTSKPVPLPFGLRTAWTKGHLVAGEN
jgi:hypothetical protein